MWHSKLNKCDSGVVGNARPCQGRDRGFEPRLSLLFDEKGHPKRMSFFVERAPSGAQSSSVSVPLRSAQSRCPPDTLRRLSLLFNKKRTSGKDVLFRRKSPRWGSKFERLRSTAVGAEQVSTGHLAPSIASVQQKRTSRKDYDKEYSSFIIFVNDMKKTILGLIKKLFNNIILRQK